MSQLEILCKQNNLADEDIKQLSALEKQLVLMADVSNADMFLDCKIDSDTAVVIAQARPTEGVSAYKKDIVGHSATKENEPAVFRSFQLGIPVCDFKAVTQEGRAVRQNTAPVKNKDGKIIAVLIREKDVSEEIEQQKKYDALAREHVEKSSIVKDPSEKLALREMHHRIKNSLQLVSSILNIQARNAKNKETEEMLKEDVGRVLSIAGIHDILLSRAEDDQTIDCLDLLERLRADLQSLSPVNKKIVIKVSGDHINLSSDTAGSLSLVITELVMNALQHAFEGKDSGEIKIEICKGSMFHTVFVEDNGTGIAQRRAEGNGLGFSIVEATVKDKLGGKVHVDSGKDGTRVVFDFAKEDNE